MKKYIRASKNLSSKSALIRILNDIKDRVIVTGSYAYGMQNEDSDIDLFIRWIPEEEQERIREETGNWNDTPEDYCKELIRYFESKGYEWDSDYPHSFAVNDTYIPLELSAYYDIDDSNIFKVNILGVTMDAAKSTTTNDKYLNGIKRSKLR